MKYLSLLIKKILYPVNPVKKISLSVFLIFCTFNLLAEAPLATTSGEFLILKNGSVIKGKTTKFDSKNGELLFNRQGIEHTVSMNAIQAISFQGSYYPPRDSQVGFHLSNGKAYEGKPSYFTTTMIGRSKPSKMRFKKNALGFLVLSHESSTKPNVKIYGISREIICGEAYSETNGKVNIKTPIGTLNLNQEQIVKIENLSGTTLLKESHKQTISSLPFLSSVKEPQFNRTFNGHPLQVKGFPTRHFLSLHTKTEMTFKLPVKSKTFTALALIDPQAINGDLILTISQNKKELYKATISSDQEPVPINISLKEGPLTIMADFGTRGSAGDFLILANPQISEVK